MAQPYAAPAYDKKAAPGYVKNVENNVTTAIVPDMKILTSLCLVMKTQMHALSCRL